MTPAQPTKETSVALITGAANGIGLAAVTAFAADHLVVLADLEDAAAAAQEIGSGAVAVSGDVTDPADCARWVETAESHGRLRSVVHAAGIAGTAQFIEDMRLDDWERIIRVNLTGSFLMAQAAIPALRRAGDGSMVLISSRSGRTGYTVSGAVGSIARADYATSKAGVISLTRSLSFELAHEGIRFNNIAPGPVETRLVPSDLLVEIAAHLPVGRLGRPEEIAAAAHYLCSPEAAFITGHTLDINGGSVMT